MSTSTTTTATTTETKPPEKETATVAGTSKRGASPQTQSSGNPSATDFRQVARQSNIRANIFLCETLVLLTTYIFFVYRSPKAGSSSSVMQRGVLAMFGVIYFARLNLMARFFLKRELAMEELTFVTLLWLPSILASFVWNINSDTIHFDTLLFASLFYGFGSYLNSYSELERKRWKSFYKNKGRCYTEGLFAYSRNINYFGDTLLFASWAVATGSWYNIWVPLAMGSSFWFHHIPDKEKYLKQRYGDDFIAYSKETPYAFIPFVC